MQFVQFSPIVTLQLACHMSINASYFTEKLDCLLSSLFSLPTMKGESKFHLHFNSLGPSGAIWWQRSGSTLAQVMACCLTAPSHYLNQCWLIISKVEWHSFKGKFTRDTQPSITEIIWKIECLKFHSNFQGANELTSLLLCCMHYLVILDCVITSPVYTWIISNSVKYVMHIYRS